MFNHSLILRFLACARSSRTDVTSLLEMFLKCADISNPAKPLVIYQRWADLVMREFYRQGDAERAVRLAPGGVVFVVLFLFCVRVVVVGGVDVCVRACVFLCLCPRAHI